MEDLPRRKPMRLTGWDYSGQGMYFLTLCTKGKRPLFGRVVGGGVLDAPRTVLSPAGETLERQLRSMADSYQHVVLKKYVIMPNHLHLLVRLTGLPHGPSGTPAPTGGRANEAVPALVSALKRFTDRACGLSLFQRGYHDHIVRDEADFLRVWTYLDENPAKWAEDTYYVKD